MELRVCEAYRIPHSHFLGGPLVWTTADREKATWHEIHKAKTCSSCGTHPDDWNPRKGGDRNAWVAGEHFCMGCQRLELAREQDEKKTKRADKPRRGTSIVLKRPEPKQDEPEED